MPFGDWKVCDTGEWGLLRSGFCPSPTLSDPENQSQSELLRDAYSSFHLWVRLGDEGNAAEDKRWGVQRERG